MRNEPLLTQGQDKPDFWATIKSENGVISLLLIAGSCLGLYFTIQNAQRTPTDQNLQALTFFFFIAFRPLAIFFHELGHAFAGKIIGAEILRINLGFKQRPVGPFIPLSFLGFNWRIYALPTAGSVLGLPPNKRHYKLRSGFFTFAGPLVSLVLAGISAFPLLYLDGYSISYYLLIGWVFSNLALFAFTILPLSPRTDGARILELFSLSPEVIRDRAQRAELAIKIIRQRPELESFSLQELEEALRQQPDDLPTMLFLWDKMVAEKIEDHRIYDLTLRMTRYPEYQASSYTPLIDSLLTGALEKGSIPSLPSSHQTIDELSRILVEKNADKTTALGTRGSVLIDLGRLDEGEFELHRVLIKTQSDLDRSYSHTFLALAAQHKGNIPLALEQAKLAKHYHPNNPALKRISALLVDVSPS